MKLNSLGRDIEMKKVALLLYGQPRFIDNQQVEDYYKRSIINRYNTDVFGHCWFKKDVSEFEYSTWSNIKKCPINPNAVEIIKQKYNPVSLTVEEPRSFELPPKAKQFIDERFTGRNGPHWSDKNYSNLMSQFWSIKSVSEQLINSGIDQYDWIALGRYDSILVNFPNNLQQMNNNKFYLPDHHNRFPDMFVFYGPRFIDWSLNLYNDIEDVYGGIWEPSSEAFKMGSFLKRFSRQDLSPCKTDAIAIRE